MPNSSNLKVSILLAVYNGEAYIEAAIQSVLNQTYENWELIIVDNGSTDNTAKICLKYAELDDRIKFFKLLEKGKTKAYNKAFEESAGDFICYFAADDILEFESIEKRLKIIELKENGTSTCLLKTFSDDSAHNGVVFPKKKDSPNYSGGSIFFHRNIAEKLFPIPSSLPNEDTWSSLHIRAFGKNFHLPEVCYHYRIHDNNSYGYTLSFEEKREKFLHRMSAYELFYEKFKNQGIDFVDVYIHSFVKALAHARKWNRLPIMTMTKLPLRERLIFVFYSSPFLYKIRYKYFKFFSGLFN
ncbi:glycosyltransferase family 2 protein [Pedobacter flavus]|uniref:Glycosyltransferase n=1 Tax=Pedobacter flavus TaxID=3113906 RepID=A0ABU7H0W2_9SPHI|nr:glycosyltransferase [Pedobacter sp. VNH31]MEE1884717.1 glycosyltransferase [Pedobacter sp. VNH31]